MRDFAEYVCPAFQLLPRCPGCSLAEVGMQACPQAPPILEALGLQASSSAETGRVLGCSGLPGLPQLWGIFLLLGCWWVQDDTGSMKACNQGPFSMSTTTPEGHWLMVGQTQSPFHSSHQMTCTMHGLLIPSIVSLTTHGSDIIISNCRSHDS